MKTNRRQINLLEGNIIKKLLLLSAPLMATSFVNMAYNMTDMAWLGRLGSEAVAAIGTAHFFIWIASSLGFIGRIGTSVYSAQEYGRKDFKRLNNTIKNGLILVMLTAIIYTIIINLFAHNLIGFYGLKEIVLDPILIFGFLGFLRLEVAGAALASIFSQFIVLSIILIDIFKSKNEIYIGFISGKFELKNMMTKFYKGFPAGAMSIFHALVSMVLARFISNYGTIPMAAFSVGSQIESITWMTTEGFSGGIIAFVGQNYGAEKFERLKEVIRKSILTVFIIGIAGTFILIIFRYPLFELFVPNDLEATKAGAAYLLILGASQLFMALEIGISAVFNGIGRTKIPASINTFFNILRIPMSILLMPYFKFYGVWLAMTISSIFKGLSMTYLLTKEYKNIY